MSSTGQQQGGADGRQQQQQPPPPPPPSNKVQPSVATPGTSGQPTHQASPSGGASDQQQPDKGVPSEEKIKAAREAIQRLIQDKECAPILLLLAFHDALTYDASSKRGGPNGSIWSHEVIEGPENIIIPKKDIWNEIKKIKNEHPNISNADFLQLAGIIAVETMNGPTNIAFVEGRQDKAEGPSSTLPNVSNGNCAENLRNTFYHMGFHDREIVALVGAYILGLQQGLLPKTTKNENLDNSYYKSLLEKYKDGESPINEGNGHKKAKELVANLEKCLATDQTFKRYVILYSEDKDKFFNDYAKAHKKMSELGFKQFPNLVEYGEQDYRQMMPSVYIATAMTIAVVVLGFLYETFMK